jgi:uncharacterized protein (UPF0264 family)
MSNSTACQLLVSANTLEECDKLLDLNVPWIDLKEPRHGPLGRPGLDHALAFASKMIADPRTRNWSIAAGELIEWNLDSDLAFLDLLGTSGHVKWGLAHCNTLPDWQSKLVRLIERLPSPKQAILVHYADHHLVDAPAWAPLLDFAEHLHIDKLLIDTSVKDGMTLLDWLPIEKLAGLIDTTHARFFKIAVAGSIRLADLPKLCQLSPDWIGLRGAVCSDPKQRTSRIDAALVKRALIESTS